LLSKKILLVDDNPDDVELTIQALRRNKVTGEIAVVHDGEAALEFLLGSGEGSADNRPALPTFVLLDLDLPRMSGFEVLRRLRADERTKLLPVVILSSSGEERDILSGYKLGVNSYVRKSVNFTSFVKAVGQLALYWLMLNEVPNGL
jgi:two-component system, response regulator